MTDALPTAAQWSAAMPTYEAYLDTPVGRLRDEVVWQHLRAALPDPHTTSPPLVLDLGSGPGRTSIRLAQAGYRVHGWEPATAMLDRASLRVAAVEQAVADRLTFTQGTLDDALTTLGAASADAIVCHNVLEFVPDPAAAIRTLAALARPGGLVSVLTLNRWSEVLRSAITTGSASQVLAALQRQALPETMTGGVRQAHDPEAVRAWLQGAGLHLTALYGIRVLSDYLPHATYEELLAVELAATAAAPTTFASLARQVQFIARKPLAD